MVCTLMLKPAGLAISRSATASCVRSAGRSEAISVASSPLACPASAKQLLGAGDVGAFERQIAVEAIGRVERRVVARRAVALGDEIDHRVAVDGQRQRLAHARHR